MKKKFILVAGLIVLAAGCQKTMQQEEPVDRPVLQSPLEGAIEGKIVVYLSDEMRDEFEAATDEDGQVRMESVKSYESVPDELQVISVERHFPKDPRFEKRERESGIDKWYDITFSQDVTLTKAADIVVGLDGIEYAEYMYEDKLADEPIYSFAVTPPFDDPRAVSQWHYQNDGSAWGSKEGSDINLYSAYERFGVYGNPEVIVAIIDGGIAYSHPDLAQNMWINTAELNGQAGVDDDGNGYVDDIYGYNFMYSGAITEQNHGSHVAGTVAAVNNNGTGVIGIAGGNGSADSGVRLMSCQIFDHKNDNSSGDADKGFKYGADNGAVIAQCSFGYDVKSATYFPAARKAAIDYFIDYAGKDDNGNQVGPMNGGVVIFAAGNDNHNVNAMAGYERVLAVAAIGADFERAYYSNYGEWVDITAPGGDAYKNSYVLSTSINGSYEMMQGTSMACPHVSGIAALVVSALGGPGFTPDELKEILLRACRPEKLYEANPNMTGMLGVGLIDTELALSALSTTAPDKIDDLEIPEPQSNVVDIAFTLPEDADDGYAYGVNVYYSTSSFSSIDYDNLPSGMIVLDYSEDEMESVEGSELEKRIKVTGLEFDTDYYFAVAAYDIAGNISELSEIFNVHTGVNHAPEILIKDEDKDFIVRTHESKVLQIGITEPDGHSYEGEVVCTGEKGEEDLDFEFQNGVLVIRINGWELPIDKYTAEIVIKDEYDMEARASFQFSIQENADPVVVAELPGVCINGVGQKVRINMNDYIQDPDMEPLTFTFTMDNDFIASLNQTAGYFDIMSISTGTVNVTVTASDAVGSTVDMQFPILVREGSDIVDVYPNPVYDNMYIRSGEDGKYELKISNAAGAVIYNDVITSSPFNPFVISMKNNPIGVYSISVKAEDGTEFKSTVAKY